MFSTIRRSLLLSLTEGLPRADLWEAHVGCSCVCVCADRRLLCGWMGPGMLLHACLGAHPWRQRQRLGLQRCLLFHSVIKLLSSASLHFPSLLSLSSSPLSLFMSFCCLLLHGCFSPERTGRASYIPGRCRLFKCVDGTATIGSTPECVCVSISTFRLTMHIPNIWGCTYTAPWHQPRKRPHLTPGKLRNLFRVWRASRGIN